MTSSPSPSIPPSDLSLFGLPSSIAISGSRCGSREARFALSLPAHPWSSNYDTCVHRKPNLSVGYRESAGSWEFVARASARAWSSAAFKNRALSVAGKLKLVAKTTINLAGGSGARISAWTRRRKSLKSS